MHKSKQPRRSRLIRKWDGTPVVDAEGTGQAIEPTSPTSGMDSVNRDDRTPDVDEVIFELEDEELSDTLER